MKLISRMKNTSKFLAIFIIILFALSISMNIIFYGSYSDNNLYEDTAANKVKTITEPPVGEDVADNMISFNTSSNATFTRNVTDSTNKVISIFKRVYIPNNIDFLVLLFVIFIIFYSFLFIFLPNDLTLVNQKVRLND